MEPLTILTVAIGFIGIFHIIDRTVQAFAKGRKATVARREEANDWYCFFRLSALLGPDWKPYEQREREKMTKKHATQNELLRKLANRPRLHV